MLKDRNIAFDIVKGIAIYLVVLGHCMQYIGHTSMSDNALHSWIYSFHMPLFFMVSGFFAASSWKLDALEFLRKKCIGLLLPCITLGILMLPFRGLENLTLINVLTLQWFPLWFIRELFKVQLLTYLAVRLSGKRMPIAVLLTMVVYVLPFCACARMMLPFFWLGYVLNKHYAWIQDHCNILLIIIAVLSGILYWFWDPAILKEYNNAIPMRMQDLITRGGVFGGVSYILSYVDSGRNEFIYNTALRKI